ncbi:MAG: polysaccharide deacetylase family protein [Acidobacteria bacterium]|nr:polysaccharide deacetylase family protein [Acidobacteriota bacterium]
MIKGKIKSSFIACILFILDICGINALFRKLNQEKAIILWYHGVCDESFNLTDRHLPKSVFRKQLSYLKDKGYIFITLSELVNILQSGGKINKYVVLTFDDGFKNVIGNALPIMRELGVKGCFYLVSDLAGTNNLLWTDQVEVAVRNLGERNFQFNFNDATFHYRLENESSYQAAFNDIKSKLRSVADKQRIEYMQQFRLPPDADIAEEFFMADWQQIRDLDSDILEIGSHTRNHPNCTSLIYNEEVEDEIKNSRLIIEKQIDRPTEHFCYPAGAYDDRVISAVKNAGYKSAATIEYGFNDANTDLYRLKRLSADPQFLLFKSRISGSYALFYKFKSFFPAG